MMNKKFLTTLEIEGKGKTKELAINTALGTIQKKVMKKFDNIILRIEPVNISVIEAKEINYTERFLFIFFPRKVKQYYVKLEIKVNIFLMDVESIPFEVEEIPETMETVIMGNPRI